MIQLSSLSKRFGDRVLLDTVTWYVGDRDRVGLCGPNGAGKTTLLRILAGLDEADGGEVIRPTALTIGYLPQDGLTHAGRTVFAEASEALRPLLDLKAEMHDLEHRLADAGVPARRRTTRCSSATAPCRSASAWATATPSSCASPPSCAASASAPADFETQAEHLSGGWQMRLALAKLLLQRAGAAAARRADQPPRPRGPQLARGLPRPLPARGDPGLARPLLPRRRGRPHRRPVAAHDHRLRLQLLAVPGPAPRAGRAAARGQAAAGRGDRPGAGVRRSVPLPGDQGGAGAEPHQDAREDRAHRGAAGAQAHPLPVPGRREERPGRAGAAAACARPTAPRWCSTASTCTSSAAIAWRWSGPTAPASRR